MREYRGKEPIRQSGESGQAMIELAVMILILLTLMMGAVEIATIYQNFQVISNAIHQATWAASLGAPDEVIKYLLLNKLHELMYSGYTKHDIISDQLRISVYNRYFNDLPVIAPRPGDEALYTPYDERTAGYIFRSEGHSIRLDMTYKIGYTLPPLGYIDVITFPITEEARIIIPNDNDRDGLVDAYEQEYFIGVNHEAVGKWCPYSHTDGGRGPDNLLDDLDLDGIADGIDSIQTEADGDTGWYMFARYDYDNDGVEDKFDDDGNWTRNPYRYGQ